MKQLAQFTAAIESTAATAVPPYTASQEFETLSGFFDLLGQIDRRLQEEARDAR